MGIVTERRIRVTPSAALLNVTLARASMVNTNPIFHFGGIVRHGPATADS